MELIKRKPKDEAVPEPPRLMVNYQERDEAMAELLAAIARILQPRGGYQVYSGAGSSFGKHFLPLPDAPAREITRAGNLGKVVVDEKAQEAFQREVQAITIRERELTGAAQHARNVVDELSPWMQAMAPTEARLGMSVLAEEDRADVEAFEREHRRFIRTCRTLAAQLDF